MRYLLSCLLICCLLATTTPALAQSPTPDEAAPRRVEFTPEGLPSLSLLIPEGWLYAVNPPQTDFYAILTNRSVIRPGEVATDIQIVLRPLEDLAEPIEATLDPDSENPALDYLTQYGLWNGNRVQGVYDPPQVIAGAEHPTALMLYIERSDVDRFGEITPGLLSLAVAIYLGNGQMAVILLDGLVQHGRLLFTPWINTLNSLELDGETPSFIADLPDLLAAFNGPENMGAVYQSIVADSPAMAPTSAAGRFPFPEADQGIYLTLNTQEIGLPLFRNWEIIRQSVDSAELVSTDQQATLRAAVYPITDEIASVSPAELVEQFQPAEGLTLQEEPFTFIWGQLIATLATLEPSDPDAPAVKSTMLLARLPDSQTLLVVTLLLQPDAPPELLRDWQDMLILAQLNEVEIDLDSMLLAFGQFPALRLDE